ncbi:MAG: AbrB/MazE/SpoVT family DNA-binding domain-containing protein [Verrucomicrobia bacterium]|jgi:bifunctional DNA-binding transcriptional regulator/antitoxin component of YhaV-PrlF toxin-antitoxin module|nr:AbrB/MazE/SpoVT family DNA-binding domain-containing protein [Verrucomicrobiota bacterium]
MSKVSTKYQITLPRDLARSHHILPGEDVVFEEAGSALYLRRGPAETNADSVEGRLASFDRASQRQEARNRAYPASLKSSAGRGWTRDELYQR